MRRAKNTRSLCRCEDAIVWVFVWDTHLRKIGTNVHKKIEKLMKSSPFSTYKCDLKSIRFSCVQRVVTQREPWMTIATDLGFVNASQISLDRSVSHVLLGTLDPNVNTRSEYHPAHFMTIKGTLKYSQHVATADHPE